MRAPSGLPTHFPDDDDAPAREVIEFCAETGASLDFIYLGDIRPMLRGDFNGMLPEARGLSTNGDAAEATDMARVRAEGLIRALYDVTMESSAIDRSHPEAVGMMAIIRALQDDIERYGHLLDAERAAANLGRAASRHPPP